MRRQTACNVEPRISSQPGTPTSNISRCRSSAATFVKVTGRILFGCAPDSKRRATLRFIANDFPVPGPATTRTKRSLAAAIPYAGDLGSRSSFHAIYATLIEKLNVLMRGICLQPLSESRFDWGRSGRLNYCDPIVVCDRRLSRKRPPIRRPFMALLYMDAVLTNTPSCFHTYRTSCTSRSAPA